MMGRIENIDKHTRKDLIISSIISLFIVIAYFVISFYTFYELIKESPSITLVKGDVKIFVNGIWIPLRAGLSADKIKNFSMKVERGEVSIGEKVKIRADYAEIEISEGEIKVAKGKADIKIENKNFELNEGEKIKAKIEIGEIKEKGEVMKSDVSEIIEEIKTEERKIVEEENKEKTQEEQKNKIIEEEEIKISQQLDEKKLRITTAKINQEGKWVKIEIEGENVKKIFVNGIPYYSGSGKYNISIPFEEGEHELKILAEGIGGEIEVIKKEKILVDITPPKIKKKSIKWEL